MTETDEVSAEISPTHYAALNKATGELLDFTCRSNLKGLLGQLTEVCMHFPRQILQAKYEASYLSPELAVLAWRRAMLVMQ